MLYSVAARFSFGESEMMNMPISKLKFWYDGHLRLYEAEQRAGEGK